MCQVPFFLVFGSHGQPKEATSIRWRRASVHVPLVKTVTATSPEHGRQPKARHKETEDMTAVRCPEKQRLSPGALRQAPSWCHLQCAFGYHRNRAQTLPLQMIHLSTMSDNALSIITANRLPRRHDCSWQRKGTESSVTGKSEIGRLFLMTYINRLLNECIFCFACY